VETLIARRGTEHGSGLGIQRRVLERALPTRTGSAACGSCWEIRHDIHEALPTLECSIICWRRLKNHHV
jgi:hypothetical protein